GVRVSLEGFRLAEKQKLCKPNQINLVCQLMSSTRRSMGNARNQFSRPLKIMGPAMTGLQRSEQGVIFQPIAMIVAEQLIGGPQIRAHAGAEIGQGFLE